MESKRKQVVFEVSTISDCVERLPFTPRKIIESHLQKLRELLKITDEETKTNREQKFRILTHQDVKR